MFSLSYVGLGLPVAAEFVTVIERRNPKQRRRATRSGRRATDPQPEMKSAVLRSLVERIEAIEHALQIQFQRIADLQLAIDRTPHSRGRKRVGRKRG